MSDESGSDLDLGAAHLRPGQRQEPRRRHPAAGGRDEPLPWEGPRDRGLAAAFAATWWLFVSKPRIAWSTPWRAAPRRRPWTFALLCGAVFGVISEVVDSSTVALIHYGGGETAPSKLFQLDLAGRSLEWLPISLLSLAGCLFAVVVAAPLFVLFYSLLVLLWTALVHAVLGLAGGLRASPAGFRGTLRAVCYSQVAMVAAIVPWIGDPIAGIWSFCLQVPGLERMHGCGRRRAVLAVAVPALLALLALLLVIVTAEPETVSAS